MKYPNIIISVAAVSFFASCGKGQKEYDASGAFETEETIISAEATGKLLSFTAEEGITLKAGENIGLIDTTQLFLKKKQLEAQMAALLKKRPDVQIQISALEEQLAGAITEQKRIQNLVAADAAPARQLDDINNRIDVIRKQIEAQKSTLSIASNGISNESVPIAIQVAQIDDQLSKCHLINPVTGTVLTTYCRQNELVAAGKPLYKIADLSNMILRVYISGNQLASVKLNQQVKVLTDDGKGGFNEQPGTITWVSDVAEFTPKTIQTKDERANLVYAMKIKVKNNGTLKIGMYGEIKF